jgi:Family of unknown function (DUF6962)
MGFVDVCPAYSMPGRSASAGRVGEAATGCTAEYRAIVLVQPAQSLTDLALGAVVVALAFRLRRVHLAHRHWQASFWWAGVAALAGAVHHGIIVRWPRPGEISWAVISAMVVVAISYLLAATVAEVLGPGRSRAFWLLRSVGLVAYVALALTGHAGITAILTCESLTMLCILALWGWAALHRHPLARPVLLGIVASGAAGAVQALSPDVTGWVGLDPTSSYHLAQIVGMVLVYRAAARPRPFAGEEGTELIAENAA